MSVTMLHADAALNALADAGLKPSDIDGVATAGENPTNLAWYLGITNGEEEALRELGVPADCELLGVIALGYPSPESKPNVARFNSRRRAFEDMFHFGRW
jgi:hypothetical protein